MNEEIVNKTVSYYKKVIADNQKAYGEDWRTLQYKDTLNKIMKLKDKTNLTFDEECFMAAKVAMAEVFGK